MGKRVNPPTGDIGCTDEVSSSAMSCGVAQAEIYFRPQSTYDGEFGFDWMRIGDWDWNRTLHATDNFVANKYSDNSMLAGGKGITGTATISAAQAAYAKLEDEYTKLPINGQTENYHFHWLSIFPKVLADSFNAEASSKSLHASARLEFSATLDILIKIKDIADKPDRIIFINGYPDNLTVTTSTGEATNFNKGTALPTISCTSITTNAKQILGTITVTCQKELKYDAPISAYAVKGDSATLAGVLMVCKNHSTKVCKKQDVLVALIKTDRTGASPQDGANVFNTIPSHEKLIYQLLHHQLLYGEVEVNGTLIDLSNDIKFRLKTSLAGSDATHADAEKYCNATGVIPINLSSITTFNDFLIELAKPFDYLNGLLPNKYRKYAKLFTFQETWATNPGVSGVAMGFSSKMAMNFREIASFHTTPAHELNHSLGLRHTFGDSDAPYIYTTNGQTDNIMSYSDRIPAHTWYWQWKIVNEKLR